MAGKSYTSESSKVYAVSDRFEDGDIVILNDDKTAWWVKKSKLAAASSVFKDMLAASSGSGKELRISDASRNAITAFLDTLFGRTILSSPMQWRDTRTAIDLLARFDCGELAKRLLYRASEHLAANDLFDAFATASQHEDLLTGCRLLAQGHKCHTGIYCSRTLSPNYKKVPWTGKEAAQLKSTWVWALALASAQGGDINEKGFDLLDNKYWRNLVGNFMSNLADGYA